MTSKKDKNDGKDTAVIGKILYTEDQIRKRAAELGEQITSDFEGEPLIVIGMLKGVVFWFADLLKNIKLDTAMDFIVASSYGSSTTSSGIVTIKYDTEYNVNGKNVLIVDDIVDTGTTLAYLVQKMKERGAKNVKVCTMLDKPSGRTLGYNADYVGFTVEDLFIIGYGLDYDQKYRNLPYVSYLTGDDI